MKKSKTKSKITSSQVQLVGGRPLSRDDYEPLSVEGGGSDDDLLTPVETAADLRCSKSYLDKLRCYGGGPSFIRLGPKKILYRRGDARGWAKARRFDSTSQYTK